MLCSKAFYRTAVAFRNSTFTNNTFSNTYELQINGNNTCREALVANFKLKKVWVKGYVAIGFFLFNLKDCYILVLDLC